MHGDELAAQGGFVLHPRLFSLGQAELEHGIGIAGTTDMVTETVMERVYWDDVIVFILDNASILVPKSQGRRVFLGARVDGIWAFCLDDVRGIVSLFLQGIVTLWRGRALVKGICRRFATNHVH